MTLWTGDPNPFFVCCSRCGTFFAESKGTIVAKWCVRGCLGSMQSYVTPAEREVLLAAYALGGERAVEAVKRPRPPIFGTDALRSSFAPVMPFGSVRKKAR